MRSNIALKAGGSRGRPCGLAALLALGASLAAASAAAATPPPVDSALPSAAHIPVETPKFSDVPVTLAASAFRVVRSPSVEAELTPGGQVVPGILPSVYLVLSATVLADPSLAVFAELRAPLSAENSRSAARIVAAGLPVSGTLRRQSEDVYTPTFDGTQETCSHAHYDVLVVTVPLESGEALELRSMREDIASRSVANSACPRPHRE